VKTEQIEITELSPQPTAVVCGHARAEDLPGFLGGAFGEVMAVLSAQGRAPAGPPFARYRPTDDGFDAEAGFPADGAVAGSGRVTAGALPGGPTACAMHRGSYATLGETYQAVQDWLAANGYEVTGAPWECYLDGPEVAEPRTLVYFPCRRP
jgi:effector-binding domain-containing protein